MADIVNAGQVYMGQSCTPHSFVHPDLFGAKFTNLEANLVTNYSMDIPKGLDSSHHATNATSTSFCNVSLEYTHPGWNDNINTQVWLPIEDWNGRLQAVGGGGFQTGLWGYFMAGAVRSGYATVSTDGGHHSSTPFDADWMLSSPGNINWALIQDFGSVALNDAAVIGKAITKDFYGRGPSKSYWSGCSMGGRQAIQIAQRYPDAFDGILAAAPAIHLPKFLFAEALPETLMHEANEYPPPCEFDAITAAATEACDKLDGVTDGIVSAPELCAFDAKELVGREIDCTDIGRKTKISELAVKIMETAWQGFLNPAGKVLWHGFSHETNLAGPYGIVTTTCDVENDGGCKPNTFPIPALWIKNLLKRDPDFDTTTLRHQDLVSLFKQSHQEFQSALAADDPDLTAMHAAGGKMIVWHGLADQLIPPNGSRAYVDAVTSVDPNARDYVRYFEAPGVGHCWGGPGPFPRTIFEKLVEWVEQGNAPDSVPAISPPGADGRVFERDVCAYPLRAKYKGEGDVTKAVNFECI